jgi:hypothetical protein
VTYPSNSNPSNYAGQDTIILGQIAALDGSEVPMYTEADACDAIRGALAPLHWFTNKDNANAFTVLIRVNGDRMFAAQNWPTNPDAPDVTA